MDKKVVWGIVVIIVLLVGWVLLKGHPTTPSETGPIQLGFIGPLTGDAADIGAGIKTGDELAVSEINAAGGINGRMLAVDYQDGQCSAQPANSAANKLINVDKVVAILGGVCSTETSAFAPGAMQSKIIVFSPGSSAPSLSQTGKYFFRDYPSDAHQGSFDADYAYNVLGARKVAIIYHISDYGTGIKNVFETEFKKLGGQIVDEEGTPQTATDYRTELTKATAGGPDYLYTPTYPAGATILLKQAAQMGIKVPFLSTDAWSDTALQGNVKGLALNILFTESVSTSTADFKAKMLAKTGGKEVPPYSATAYDSVYILANALKSAGTDPDALAAAIRATKYNGVSGQISFDQNGDITSSQYEVKKIANGTATLVTQ